jgi:hypothetical protein
VSVLPLIGVIQNISSTRRIREYSCTITVPRCCLTFSSSHYAAEIKSDESEFRKFRFTEKQLGSTHIHPGENLPILSVEIAVGHLPPEHRTKCLNMVIRADALVEGEPLHLNKRVDEFIAS